MTPGAGIMFNGVARAATSDILTCKVRLKHHTLSAVSAWALGVVQQQCRLPM